MATLRNRYLNGKPWLLGTSTVSSGTTPTYATSFTISAPSSMTVGTASSIIVTPVGGAWNGQTVTPAPNGLSGQFSPPSAIGSGTTAIVFTFTPSASGSGSIGATASPSLTSGGAQNVTVSAAQSGGTTQPASNGPMSQTFTLTNWNSAVSPGLHKRGVWFKKDDVPAGSVPVLSNGAGQFYGFVRRKNGSLRTARLLLRDSAVASGGSVNYTMTTATGTAAAVVNGNAGLASALAGHDIKVAFTTVKTWDCSNDNGNYAALGSGAFTASLAGHAATSTRWTVLTTGPVADVWQGWGMATDNANGTADAHLKVNWYVTRWKNADGSTLGFQIGAIVALDWWSVPNKYFLTYDAALKDGSTTVVSFPGVRHHYHSQWLMCINDGSLNAGTAPWIGVAQPTLHCSFDRDYAVASGVVPPLDTAKRPSPATQYAYVPCGVVADPDTVAHGNSHRQAIDAAGGYNGRGVLPRFDSDAFMAGTPLAYTVARLNALSGLGVPYHYRSNRMRTRPGEGADVANTSIPLLMAPKSDSYSDFTAQGLPIPVNAYTGNSGDSAGRDNFRWPVGIQDPNNGNYSLDSFPGGSRGGWGPSLDASHAVSYCYFMALISGDEWLLEAQLNLAMNLAHQTIWGYHQKAQLIALTYNSATPSDRWTGLLGQWQDNNPRSTGWSQLIQGHGFGLLPNDHIFYPAAQATIVHQGDYIAGNLDNFPADFAASSTYYPEGYAAGIFSPWMAGLQACGAYAHYLINEDTRWKRLGDFTAGWAIAQAAAKNWYWFDIYRTLNRTKNTSWNATTNPQVPSGQQCVLKLTADYVASTNRFTASGGAFWSENNGDPPPLSNGDPVVLSKQTDGGTDGNLPPGGTDGQALFIVNVTAGRLQHEGTSNPPTFQLATSPGGTPIAFTGDQSRCNMGYRPANGGLPQVAMGSQSDGNLWPYMPSWDNYVPISVSVIMMARQAGNTACTAAMRDGAIAFTAPMDGRGGYYSAFDMATTA